MKDSVKVWNEGKGTLVYTKLYEYVPRIRYYVGFWANPREVLKYGSNGLHFAEHIAWNMINSKCQLLKTNAVTYGSGEMLVYGESAVEDYTRTTSKFFESMTDIATRKMSKKFEKDHYRLEQRRVTSETFQVDDRGWLGASMFVANSDMKEGEFDIEYFWRILLDESTLGRVLILTTTEPTDADIAHFRKSSKSFTAAWDSRKRKVGGNRLKYPMFSFPPVCLLPNYEKGSLDGEAIERGRSSESTHSIVSLPNHSMIASYLVLMPFRYINSLSPMSLTQSQCVKLKAKSDSNQDKVSKWMLGSIALGKGRFTELCLLLSTYSGEIDEDQLRDLVDPSMTYGKLLKKYKVVYQDAMKDAQEFIDR